MRTYLLLHVVQNSSFVTCISFLPVFQKQKLLEFFMVLTSVWKCYFTNIASYSSLLQFTSVKYASYFQFSFERKSFWKVSVTILFTHDQCCLVNDSWEVVASLLWLFSVLALWTQWLLGETLHSFSSVWFQILFSGFLQIRTSKGKQDFLSSSSTVFSHLKF